MDKIWYFIYHSGFCEGCGECCKNVSPRFDEDKLNELALATDKSFEVGAHLVHHQNPESDGLESNYEAGVHINKILDPDSFIDYFWFELLPKENGDCYFLEDGLCTVYKVKPEQCGRAYCGELKYDLQRMLREGILTIEQIRDLDPKGVIKLARDYAKNKKINIKEHLSKIPKRNRNKNLIRRIISCEQ